MSDGPRDPDTAPLPAELHEQRHRLLAARGREYWRRLEELAESPALLEHVTRQYPSQIERLENGSSRREFLRLMGASLALAGVTSCTRQPEERIHPYATPPEEVVPGRPLFSQLRCPW